MGEGQETERRGRKKDRESVCVYVCVNLFERVREKESSYLKRAHPSDHLFFITRYTAPYKNSMQKQSLNSRSTKMEWIRRDAHRSNMTYGGT